ncbi:MAG: FxsA family protein [Proteobacteria bacterium]|nr:FxsA family protein [Pseudomonadota bacterium]
MAILLLILFLGVPALEIAVFITVGGWLGVWPTLGLTLLTAIAGTALLRRQGLQTLMRARDSLDRGALPLAQVLEGVFLVLAGVLLLTPGFVTDTVGLALFVPAFRRHLVGAIGRWLVATGRVSTAGPGPEGPTGRGGGRVIEGDFEVFDDKQPRPPKGRSVVPPNDPC